MIRTCHCLGHKYEFCPNGGTWTAELVINGMTVRIDYLMVAEQVDYLTKVNLHHHVKCFGVFSRDHNGVDVHILPRP